MRESTLIQSWIDRGYRIGTAEVHRDSLLQFIRAKLQGPVPETIRLAAEGTNDPEVLERWFDAALSGQTIQDLLNVMRA